MLNEDCQNLRECPFCGGKAEIKTTNTGYSAGEFSASYEVGCPSCKIRFKGTSYFVLKGGQPVVSVDGYNECIIEWNRRVSDGTSDCKPQEI